MHNAGALTATHALTADGFEATYAAQVLGPHVLTTGLLGLLQAGTSPRVITVSSGGMYAEGLNLHSVHMPADSYDGVRAYARAKRAQVAMTQEWAARFPAPGRLPQHAPGVGRHRRGPGGAAGVPPGDRADATDRGRGRRHDRLARRGAPDPGPERHLLAGPPTPPHGVAARNRGITGRARATLGHGLPTDRCVTGELTLIPDPTKPPQAGGNGHEQPYAIV